MSIDSVNSALIQHIYRVRSAKIQRLGLKREPPVDLGSNLQVLQDTVNSQIVCRKGRGFNAKCRLFFYLRPGGEQGAEAGVSAPVPARGGPVLKPSWCGRAFPVAGFRFL